MRIRILASKYRLKTLKKCSNRLIIQTYILAFHLKIDASGSSLSRCSGPGSYFSIWSGSATSVAVRDVYPGSRNFLPKKLSLSSLKYGFGIRDPGSGKNIFRIPDPRVKKAPDPGSGSATQSATLLTSIDFLYPGWVLSAPRVPEHLADGVAGHLPLLYHRALPQDLHGQQGAAEGRDCGRQALTPRPSG